MFLATSFNQLAFGGMSVAGVYQKVASSHSRAWPRFECWSESASAGLGSRLLWRAGSGPSGPDPEEEMFE